MALEQRTEVEKDPHEGSWGSRARQVSKEYIPEGRRHVAKTASGCRILATIPQGGRRGRRPSRAGALSERTARPPIGTRGQPLVSSLAADDSVNDAPTPCPGRGCPAGFVTSRELRESVATYVLLTSGEHERVDERNPSKASTKAPAFIYSGVILLYQLQKNALLRVPASGCERTSACVHRFSS